MFILIMLGLLAFNIALFYFGGISCIWNCLWKGEGYTNSKKKKEHFMGYDTMGYITLAVLAVAAGLYLYKTRNSVAPY